VRPEVRALLLAGGLLVLVEAVVLASVLTPAPHTGGDNAAYLSLGYALTQGLGYVELWEPLVPPHTKYPPAFPLFLAGLMAVGVTTWTALKAGMAVLLSAAVILVFVWAGARRGAMAGLGVALLVLLSGGWLDASRWILSEPLFLTLTFLSLWAADRGGLVVGPGLLGAPRTGLGRREEGASTGGPDSPAAESRPHPGWVVAAGAAALLGLLTRSAGLPLVLALGGLLLLSRRTLGLALFGGAALVVAGGWALRARQGGEGAYQSEFWMVSPYEPELGTIGVMELPLRVWENLGIYLGTVLPGEWWPVSGALLAALGLLLAGMALAGWGLRILRGEVGTAELFLPLYTGLILLWPPVWSGDRFALPLYPLVLFYAGEALAAGITRLRGSGDSEEARPRRRSRGEDRTGGPSRGLGLAAGTAAFLLLAVPAIPTWLSTAEDAAACRAVAGEDVFRCHPPPVAEFREAALWAGTHLPEDAVVLNRKPRIFYLLGGSRGRIFPFSRDPAVLLEEADALGARYLLLGFPDGVTLSYLPAVVEGRPGAFCVVEAWGEGTTLLGILPPGEREGTQVTRCPPDYRRDPSRSPLQGLDPGPGQGPGDPQRDGRHVPLLLR
jgi:hypothetical protein